MSHGETKEPRGRNFAFVQKVENLPENWEEIIKEKLLPMAYILHNKDIYTEKDEQKEPEHKAGMQVSPHVHFFVYFSGKKTISGVLNMFSDLNIAHVEKIECKNAYLAYMLHLRQEGKHTYGYDELKIINGLKVNYADLNDVDFGDVLDFADKFGISRFCELVQATKRHDPPLFRYVSGHYALVVAYFADARDL